VGTIDEMTPLESVNVVSVAPKKVPPHPPVCRIHPPDLPKPLLSTVTPAPDVTATLSPAPDVVTASGLVPALDNLPTMTPLLPVQEILRILLLIRFIL
jgi:hypothetical protein